MTSLWAECSTSYRPLCSGATLQQNVQDRDFPSRRVRKKPPQADIEEFKAKCRELRRFATTQEQSNPVSFALETVGLPLSNLTSYTFLNILLYAWHRYPPLPFFELLWGDIGLARNMCKFQPHKPGPTQTPCAPPVRELWVACSATQELPTRPSYAPKTLEQKRKSVGTKKAVLEVLGQKKFTLDTQVTHWHTASKRCQPAWLQTYRDWRIDRWIGGR